MDLQGKAKRVLSFIYYAFTNILAGDREEEEILRDMVDLIYDYEYVERDEL